ncbi:MAG TPA: hypothetical protein VKH46_04285 [Thermoanaerobaculia bacterium]|nr:hypothetical protein [Thermoanaerobaculia bacterium]
MSLLLAMAALTAIGAIAPPLLIRRSRDRLAAQILARAGPKPSLLTPADLCTGRFRRVPGVLGLEGDAIVFESRHERPLSLPLSRIRRISSGSRMTTTGRRLLRAEVLTLADSEGNVAEFLMPKASVYQWRQHLGAWAAREKKSKEP